MARLKNLNLATLSPAQQQWWKGLKDAPQLGPGTKSFRFPIKPQKRPGAGKPSHGNTGTPDTPIADLALQAALFLTQHFTDDVAEVGEPAFKAARVQEILTGNFPPKYWLECTMQSEETRIGYPACSTNHPPPPLKFQTPGSKNTVCQYDTTYPDSGNAGYSGMTAADEFYRDQWLKQKNYVFELPEPEADVGLRPLFCNVIADWSVTLQKAHRQPFCSLFKSAIAKDEAALADKNLCIDRVSRYFYYQYEPPAPPSGGGTVTMHREFRVDCNYLAGDYGFDSGKAGVALLQLAPASARGLYHFGNTSMDTSLALQVRTFQAKISGHDPADSPGVPLLQGLNGNFFREWEMLPNSPPGRTNNRTRQRVSSMPLVQEDGSPWPPGHLWAYPLPCGGKALLHGGVKYFARPPSWNPAAIYLTDWREGYTRQCQPDEYCPLCEDGPTYINNTMKNDPCDDLYMTWGYAAFNIKTQTWKPHTFLGLSPGEATFNALWLQGFYPL